MKRSVSITIVFLLLVLTMSSSAAFAKSDVEKARDAANKVVFLAAVGDPQQFDNGLVVTFKAPASGQRVQEPVAGYYHFDWWFPTIDGVSCKFKNTSDQVLVIKWSESAISTGSFSGVPFLDGMRYTDAGNPSATPDTLIPPGNSVQKDIFLPRTEFKSYWRVIGEPIPINGSVQLNLAIKVVDSKGAYQYLNLQVPPAGIPTT
ncbi:MAG: hypothetical protein ABFC57_06220 [Veillonellales bacterium]